MSHNEAGKARQIAMVSASSAEVDALERRVSAELEKHGLAGKRLLVAVSGGPDSMSLLHALWRLSDEYRLTLCGAHLNHMLRGEVSDADAEFVADTFRSLGIDYTLDSADVAGYRRRHRLSLEDAARRLRYAFLAKAASQHDADAIALGHTADDQAETVLMHIIRGSGLDGLRGMQALDRRCISDTQVTLFRPLLDVSRAETQAYCDALELEPRIDVSNSSPEFFRNRIRLELVPLLEQLNPSVQAALIRLARNATLDSDFIRERSDEVWRQVAQLKRSATGEVILLNTQELVDEHPAIQSVVLRKGIAIIGGEAAQRHVLDMMRLIGGAPGKMLDLPGKMIFATDYGKALIGGADAVGSMLSTLPTMRGEYAVAVPGDTEAGAWVVHASVQHYGDGSAVRDVYREESDSTNSQLGGAGSSDAMDLDRVGKGLRIRGRLPGDRFQPLGMEQSKSLREFMIDARIPRRWRDGLPLLVSERGIVCVPGWRIAHWARVTDETRRVLRLSVSHISARDAAVP